MSGTSPDILKIDAEGFDPAVLQGAKATLGGGHTAVLLFEYNPEYELGIVIMTMSLSLSCHNDIVITPASRRI